MRQTGSQELSGDPSPSPTAAEHSWSPMRPVGERGPLDFPSEICERLYFTERSTPSPPCPPVTCGIHMSIRCPRWIHGRHIGLKCVRVCFMWTYVSNVWPVGRVLLGVSGSVFVSVPLWHAPGHMCPPGNTLMPIWHPSMP